MIEITAKLIKGSVYLTGQIVECSITFNHLPCPTHKYSQSYSDLYEVLAWASAQITCQCTMNEKLNKDDAAHEQLINNTALSTCMRKGDHIELTKPKILFCELRLSPGQSKTYLFKEKIPSDAPPSYRGQLVKYSYKLIIGTQKVNMPVKLLKVPLRILPISTIALNDINGLCNDTTEDLAPANPFLEVRQSDTSFDMAIQSLQNITARRKPNFYMISNTWGRVARFCLFKPAYKLGEDIIGTFDFTVATVSCVQFLVSLQCEEETNVKQNNGEVVKHSRIMTFNKQHDVCMGLRYTQLVLPTPLHVTPEFSTPLMSLNWRLHFEFVTTTDKVSEIASQVGSWQAPTELTVETMVWSLPIKIFSTTPSQVAQGLQSGSVYRLNVN